MTEDIELLKATADDAWVQFHAERAERRRLDAETARLRRRVDRLERVQFPGPWHLVGKMTRLQPPLDPPCSAPH